VLTEERVRPLVILLTITILAALLFGPSLFPSPDPTKTAIGQVSPTATATKTPTPTNTTTATATKAEIAKTPTATVETATITPNAQATQTAMAQATQTTEAQAALEATATAQTAEANAQATQAAEAQATIEAQETANAQATLDAQATSQAAQTAEAQAAATQAVLDTTATAEAQAAAQASQIAEAQTATAQAAQATAAAAKNTFPILLDPPPEARVNDVRPGLAWKWDGGLDPDEYFQVEIRNRSFATIPVIDEFVLPIDVAWVRVEYYQHSFEQLAYDPEFTWRVIVVKGIPAREKDWSTAENQVWEPGDNAQAISQPSEMRTLFVDPPPGITTSPSTPCPARGC